MCPTTRRPPSTTSRATAPTAPGYATSYPCGVTPPSVSNLNYFPGRPVANGTITGLAGDGDLCVFNSSPTDLIVDLIGWTRGAAHYVPVNPVRALDTREAWDVECDIALVSRDIGTGTPLIEAMRAGSPARTALDMPPINWMNTIIGPDCATRVRHQQRGRRRTGCRSTAHRRARHRHEPVRRVQHALPDERRSGAAARRHRGQHTVDPARRRDGQHGPDVRPRRADPVDPHAQRGRPAPELRRRHEQGHRWSRRSR